MKRYPYVPRRLRKEVGPKNRTQETERRRRQIAAFTLQTTERWRLDRESARALHSWIVRVSRWWPKAGVTIPAGPQQIEARCDGGEWTTITEARP